MTEREHLIREVADLRHSIELLIEAAELHGKLVDAMAEQMRLYQVSFEAAMNTILAERAQDAAVKALLDRLTKRSVM